jgi:hypothetical protein
MCFGSGNFIGILAFVEHLINASLGELEELE